jgi:hypothetical protein
MERRIEQLTLACFLVVPLFLCLFPIVSRDIGFHLQAGAWIWSHGEIPRADPFSYTAFGRPWIDSHWLFQVILFAIHSAAGLPGLVILRIGIVLASVGLVLATCWRRDALGISVAVCTLAVLASFGRFWVRPELFSILFLALFFYLVEHVSRFPRRALVGVFACQVVWVNAHGLHPLGVAFLALYLAGDAIQYAAHRRVPRLWGGDVSVEGLKLRLALVCCAAVALLLNANGTAGMLYPLSLFLELHATVDWFPRLAELQPPVGLFRAVVPDPIFAYFALVAVSALALLANWRRARLAHVLPYLAFLYLSLLAARNAPLFAVVAAPIAIRSLRCVRPARFAPRTPPVLAPICSVALATVMAVTVANGAFYRQLGWPHWGFGVAEPRHYPDEVVEHLRALEGNVWNSSDLGGYLIWKLWPEKQVGIDGRWEVYGELLLELQKAYSDPETFDRLAEAHDIRAVVLTKNTVEARRMFPWLSHRPGWALTRSGMHAFLFERSERRHRRR